MSKETGQGRPNSEPTYQRDTHLKEQGVQHKEEGANTPYFSFFHRLKERRVSKDKLTSEEISELVEGERKEWKRVLGAEVEIKTPPEFITHKVIRNLERLCFGLRYPESVEFGASYAHNVLMV